MLDTPGKDSETSIENFEKAVLMMTVSIGDWIEQEISADSSQLSSYQPTKKGELLIHATDHLRLYGIIGAHVAAIVTLSIASLWAQSQIRLGRFNQIDLKDQMSWVMQSPAAEFAIRDTFKTLDESEKHEAEKFARGIETFINTFAKSALEKFSSQFIDVNQNFHEKNHSDLKSLQEFLKAVDEGGLSYIAKVLELVISTSMNNTLFKQEFNASYSDYYSCTVELINDIFELK